MPYDNNTTKCLHCLIMISHDILRFYGQKNKNSISIPRMRLLTALHHYQPLTLKDLSELLMISPPSLCITLGKTVKEGYVQRYIDPKNRRNTYFQLCPAGEAYLQQETSSWLEFFDQALSFLTTQEKEDLAQQLLKICDTLEIVKKRFEQKQQNEPKDQ